jgi:hypothetical protein
MRSLSLSPLGAQGQIWLPIQAIQVSDADLAASMNLRALRTPNVERYAYD